MAKVACVPCDCIDGNIGIDKYHQDVETILCALTKVARVTGWPYPIA